MSHELHRPQFPIYKQQSRHFLKYDTVITCFKMTTSPESQQSQTDLQCCPEQETESSSPARQPPSQTQTC